MSDSPIRIEAETFNFLGRASISNLDGASGGQVVYRWGTGNYELSSPATSGSYEVVLGYVDESDGQSTINVYIGDSDVAIASWMLDEDTDSLTEFTISSDLFLEAGTSIRIETQRDGGEPVRLDYIEFRPVGDPSTPPPAPENNAPIADADRYATDENTVLIANATIGVLDGDTDADGHALTATLLSGPANGVLVLNADGSFTYTPNEGFTGTDSFTYVANDGQVDSAPATVEITVNPVEEPSAGNNAPDAVDDTITVAEDTAVTVAVLGNDTDADGDSLTITEVTDGANGTVQIDPVTGNPIYMANANFNGSDTFTYTIADGNGGTATATVTVTVTDINDAPVALDDAATTTENSPVITVNVLENDRDIDGTLSILSADGTSAAGATVINNGDGTFTYDPGNIFDHLAAGETATDTFTYTVSDDDDATDTATVTVTITGAAEAPESPPGPTPTVIRVEAEDFDEFERYQVRDSEDASNGQIIQSWGRGSATMVFDGPAGNYEVVLGYLDESDGKSTVSVSFDNNVESSFVFDRNTNSFEEYTVSGSKYITPGTEIRIDAQASGGEPARIDYIEFRLIDGEPGPPGNSTPFANPDSVEIRENEVTSINLVANDSDADNDPLTIASIDTTGTLGNVEIAADGEAVIYNPGTAFDYLAEGETGFDTFTYTVSDGRGGTDTETVTVTINGQAESPPPTGTADYSSATQGVILNLEKQVALQPKFGALGTPTIMPLGDSITAGEHSTDRYSGGYRIQFWARAEEDDITIDFVGRQSNGPDSLGDQNHEGYPGYNINNLNATVVGSGAMGTISPDVVLIMAGTNDANQGQRGTWMIGSMRNMIDSILAANPNSFIFVSTIPPMDEPNGVDAENENVDLFNSLLPDLVAEYESSHPNQVFLVDAGGSLTVGDMNGVNSNDPTVSGRDGIHPTNDGYTKLGDAWYDGVFNPESLAGYVNLIGSSFADRLIGNGNSNRLTGGGGADELTGGGNADTFVYRSANEGGDTIKDFGSDDIFEISASGFGGGLSLGTLDGSQFVSGSNPSATTNEATFLFNTTTGTLSFDADGIGSDNTGINNSIQMLGLTMNMLGSENAVEIATLSNGHMLQADQINIVA